MHFSFPVLIDSFSPETYLNVIFPFSGRDVGSLSQKENYIEQYFEKKRQKNFKSVLFLCWQVLVSSIIFNFLVKGNDIDLRGYLGNIGRFPCKFVFNCQGNALLHSKWLLCHFFFLYCGFRKYLICLERKQLSAPLCLNTRYIR